MHRNSRVYCDVAGVARLRTTIVINLFIQEDPPTWNDVGRPIRVDRTKPIVFGFRQSCGNPVPIYKRDGLIHIASWKFWSGNFYWFHTLNYKTISPKAQSIQGRGSNPFA